MKNFKVTFKETDRKYNPMTRHILVSAEDEIHAKELVYQLHGSFKLDKSLKIFVPSEAHIKVTHIKEVKEKHEKSKKVKRSKKED